MPTLRFELLICWWYSCRCEREAWLCNFHMYLLASQNDPRQGEFRKSCLRLFTQPAEVAVFCYEYSPLFLNLLVTLFIRLWPCCAILIGQFCHCNLCPPIIHWKHYTRLNLLTMFWPHTVLVVHVLPRNWVGPSAMLNRTNSKTYQIGTGSTWPY